MSESPSTWVHLPWIERATTPPRPCMIDGSCTEMTMWDYTSYAYGERGRKTTVCTQHVISRLGGIRPPAQPLQGIKAKTDPASFARKWKQHVPWVEPTTLPPETTKTRVDVVVTKTRTGNVKDVAVGLPDSVPLPSGAKGAIKRLAVTKAEIIVSYAKGYDITRTDGENKRSPIWEVTEPAVTYDAADNIDGTGEGTDAPEEAEKPKKPRAKRKRIGFEAPAAVDSVLVRGVWRNDLGSITSIVGGWWTAGKPDSFKVWHLGSPVRSLEWTEFAAVLDTLAGQ